MKIKAKVLAAVTATAALLSAGGFAASAAFGASAPAAATNLYGCVAGTSRTLQNVYTNQANYQSFLDANGGKCPSGFEVTVNTSTGSTPAPTPTPSSVNQHLAIYTPEQGSGSSTGLDSFPVKPGVVNYYSGWEEGFQSKVASLADSHSATLFVEMEPWNDGNVSGGVPSMVDIANGKYDTYLNSFASSIAAYGKTTWVTFAHEQNGNWYPWGHGGSEGTTDAQWIAAWRHVHDVMNAKASNIKWVFAPNVEPNCCEAASATYPGSSYVDIVGIDGYLRSAGDTYASVFGSTVADVKSFAPGKPIWIAETGITPADSTRAGRITKYVNDVKAAGIAGLLYFNQYDFALNASEKQTLANAMAGWQ